MSGPSLAGAVDLERVRAQLKRWQERLLDLTKGNPLLGLNRSRVSKLRVTEPGAHALFRDFVVPDESTLELPRVVRKPRANGTESATESHGEYEIEAGDVAFEASPVDLHRRLRRIFDNARTTVEERGVTTLHLSFGVLRWEDQKLGPSVSPLWLVPSTLESRGPSAALRLLRADEEALLNPALALYLRELHRVELANPPDDVSPSSLEVFLETAQAAVREHGWRVEPEVWLSTYSFESLVIYQDLKNLADAALANRVVIALSKAGMPPERSEALGEDVLDILPTPERVPVAVLPTDSSQLTALTIARGGRHLVVHGPPGTGKSQTIANLIADGLGQGKKVLFVSAKMAALDVVHDRLERLGLGRFCLEAHSTKAGKAKIIDELRRTLVAAEGEVGRGSGVGFDDLLRVRVELNSYVRDLHERQEPLGLSLYEVFGRAERLRGAEDVRASLPWTDLLTVSRSELNAACDALSDLGAQADVFDARSTHPWRGLAVNPEAPPRRDALEVDLLVVRETLATLARHLESVAPLWGSLSDSLTISTLRVLAESLRQVAALDRLPDGWASRELNECFRVASLLDTAAAKASELATAGAEHERIFAIPADQALVLLTSLDERFGRWPSRISLAYWRWRTTVRANLRPGVRAKKDTLRSWLARLRRIQALEEWFATQTSVLDAEAGGDRKPDSLTMVARRLRVAGTFRRALAAAALTPSPPTVLTDETRRHANAMAGVVLAPAFSDTLGRLDLHWPDGFVVGAATTEASLPSLWARIEELLAAQPKLYEWIALAHTVHRCRQLGLGPFIDALGALSARVAAQALERRFYTAWAETFMGQRPTLVAFSGARRDELIARFRDIDAATQRVALTTAVAAAETPARRIATAQGGAGEASQVGTLRRELEKRRRLKPLRRLFAEIPTVLQALKPCFLMSPLSVSTFLQPGALRFDLVVFDEASQLPTPQAIPSILRAEQVIVAGDRNQLPPTSFFEASVIVDDEGAEELEPLDSLLDDCVAVVPVFEQAHLRWHYRSRDERLIRFSNHYFYRDRPLITFPSVAADPEDQGVSLIYVADGVWDRGGSRTNRTEARRAAELVFEQLTRHPERSIGVAAMNTTQREAIEEEIEALTSERLDLAPLLDPRRPEPFFIKALENVQGDERDTIVISVGYGKSTAGALSYNFGPLNQEGGWRRLNVLVTRARWHTIVLTSLRSQELTGVNPENRGAVALRNFIAYAEQGGRLPADAVTVTDAETNDFEDAVAEALRERGFQVDAQVGASAYKIDLAIRDPRDLCRYLLGVECDGATYHSSRNARDRDLLRQEVLRAQGWRLYRVWSTEWFRDRDKALAGLFRAAEQARETPVEAAPLAPPLPTVAPSPASEGPGQMKARPTPHDASPIARRFPPGEPYRRYHGRGRRDVLLEPDSLSALVDQVVSVVETEGPIHEDVLLDRLKELNDVDRAGINIQRNVGRASTVAAGRGLVKRNGEFLYSRAREPRTFRVPGDDVERALAQIAPEEIALAVLYKVEDQFGYQRQALPRVVAELFGFDRLPAGGAERIGSVVDELVERGVLTATGVSVFLA